MKNKKGFTLTEMMVVVLILATLAAISYPLYTKVIMKERVAEAISLGEIIREAQQRNLTLQRRYLSGFDDSHISGRTRLIKGNDVMRDGVKLKKGLYTMSIADSADTENGCIVVSYGPDANYPIFTVFMHVEDSKIWCEETDNGDKICDAVRVNPLETANDCSTH